VPDIDYGQSTKRLFRWAVCIGCIGFLISFIVWGKRAGFGFGIGATAALANLWIWDAVAQSISGTPGKRSRLAGTLFAARFLALFAFGYVIVSYLDVSPFAAVVGLLTGAAAILAEIVFELAAFKRLSQ
jgi:hypothetical protein